MLSGALLAFFCPEAPGKVSHPAAAGLTFTERVAYQRAIEDVYWRHRIWPKERPDPNRPGHYTTNPRYFYNFATGQIITM